MPDFPVKVAGIGDLSFVEFVMAYIAVSVHFVTNLELLHFGPDHLHYSGNVKSRDCVPNRPSQLNQPFCSEYL